MTDDKDWYTLYREVKPETSTDGQDCFSRVYMVQGKENIPYLYKEASKELKKERFMIARETGFMYIEDEWGNKKIVEPIESLKTEVNQQTRLFRVEYTKDGIHTQDVEI